MLVVHKYQEADFCQDKERLSDSTVDSQQTNDYSERSTYLLSRMFELAEFRNELFESQIQEIEITNRVNQKAVCWAITICWMKNLGHQCLWLTLQLYYVYKAKKVLKKEDIELTMLSCLWLSIKMTESSKITLLELSDISNKKIPIPLIVEKEAEILQLLNYNLVIPNLLELFVVHVDLQQQKKDQVLFFAELHMARNHQIFNNGDLLLKIIKLIEGNIEKQEKQAFKSEMLGMLKHKEIKIILSKYSSKFDTDQLIADLF